MTTAHELARQLLALPDLPVCAVNGASGVIELCSSASLQEHDADELFEFCFLAAYRTRALNVR